MERFLVVAMRGREDIKEAAEQIKQKLEKKGCICRINTGYVKKENVPGDTQCAIVLGGDGTLLQAGRELVETGIRLIGINFGNLGFLAEVEKEDIDKTLEQLVSDQFFLEERMLLTGKIIRGDRVISENVALNDIVINRSRMMQIMKLKIKVNGLLLNEYLADGIILSTPTGSTAYSMSAGGPIVNPSAQLIVMTPICPHTLNTRSIIFDANDVIEIQACQRRPMEDDEKKVFFDGEDHITLEEGDTVVIERSPLAVTIIKLGSRSFLENLRKKMSR